MPAEQSRPDFGERQVNAAERKSCEINQDERGCERQQKKQNVASGG
jgi:hypothetical protein